MFAVHINSQASAPVQGLRTLFASEAQIPYRHTDEYFAMDFRLTRDAVHVISSGIDPQGWKPVPEDTAAVVDLSTLELRRVTTGLGHRGRARRTGTVERSVVRRDSGSHEFEDT